MSNPTNTDPHVVTIHDVRLSFPNLFKAKQGTDAKGQPSGEAKFGAVFLLEKVKNKADIAKLTTAAQFTKKEKWQDKVVNLIGKCIREGSEKEATDGYGATNVFISASNTHRVPIVDQKLQPLSPEDGKPYAGCYVDATVRCWAQDNSYGKRLNWSLVNVQYRRKGDPFGEKPIPVESTLGELPDEDDGQVDQTPAAADSNI